MKIEPGREIDYNKLISNIDEMINALEFDGMRSAGKIKINISMINDLYTARTRYEKMVKVTHTPKKEG